MKEVDLHCYKRPDLDIQSDPTNVVPAPFNVSPGPSNVIVGPRNVHVMASKLQFRACY